MSTPSGPSTGALQIIRISLVMSVSLMAAVAILRHQPKPPGALPAVAVVLAMGAVVTMFVLRERAATQPHGDATATVIIAWALGEGAALFGWVTHLLGAPLLWAIPGTLAFLAAIATIPIPDQG